ncbi:TonB-dependent receptor [Spongiibacter sp. KMU-158]|uniref:TonB-dependent receptor n=1 Tax=Spongiibacter pelagi TaxID=2760804 RepID=A0A927C0X8_9GAMM|nr:TonB-dependent receptor [Spongiibacter pelagi]MBD2857862.1 TonB-dependent receptor [Spongiibacter pelagi]
MNVTRFGKGIFAVSVGLVAGSTQARDLSLEEVVVTAQKREQSAMTVPVTVDTFTNQDVENTGALNMADIQAYIPGLRVGSNVQNAGGMTQSTFVIRGIETSNISTGGDPSVASFLDGVYLPRAAITVPFSDMERVEVLKGPQGTLFGRNAAAGVVNFIPNQPSFDEKEGFVHAKFGEYGLFRIEGMGNYPVSDDFAIRVNAMHNQRDAVIDNTGPSKPDPREQDNQFLRVAMNWQISPKWRTLLAADIDRVDNGPQAQMGISQERSDHPDPTERKLSTDAMGAGEARDMYGVTGKLFYDLNDTVSLMGVASYRDFETYNLQDEDGTADPDVYVDTNNLEDSNISYFELQANIALDWVDVVMGANYSQEDTYQQTALTFGYGTVIELASGMVGIPPALLNSLIGSAVEGSFVTETMTNEGDFKNYGIYGDMDFTITDRLNLIAGVRYSKDEKTFSWLAPLTDFPLSQLQGANFFFNTDGFEQGSADWSKATGRLVANYQVTEEAMVFGSYSTGYKSGGYDSLNTDTKTEPLEPEVVENIELGFKGDLLSGHLRTQTSLFYMTIDARQEDIESRKPGSNAAVPTVINTDEEIQGIEITTDWLVNDALRFGLVYTYREQQSTREPYYNAQGDYVADDVADATTPQEYTLSLDWSPTISYGSLFLHVDYIYEENTDPENEDHIDEFNVVPGYGDDTKLLNARLTFVMPNGDWEFALWGKNLTDNKRISQPGGLTGDVLGTYHVGIVDPRILGVDVKRVF